MTFSFTCSSALKFQFDVMWKLAWKYWTWIEDFLSIFFSIWQNSKVDKKSNMTITITMIFFFFSPSPLVNGRDGWEDMFLYSDCFLQLFCIHLSFFFFSFFFFFFFFFLILSNCFYFSKWGHQVLCTQHQRRLFLFFICFSIFCVRFQLLIYTNSIDYVISHWQAILFDSDAALLLHFKEKILVLNWFGGGGDNSKIWSLSFFFLILFAELLFLWSVGEL